MKQVNQVGVDVDSQELVCAMQRGGQRMPLATLPMQMLLRTVSLLVANRAMPES